MAAQQSSTGTVGRVIEITARSGKSFEDAVQVGIERAASTLRHIEGAWIKEQRVEVQDGRIVGYQVNMLVTFLLEDTLQD